jgi:phosphate transport system substrate-binding protein
MKKFIILTLVAALLFGNQINAQKIKGSDTMLPLTQKISENYKGSKASVTGGGSGVGISALIEGSCDIAMASRKMKFDEKNKFTDNKLNEVVVAYDALAVIVNPKNQVDKLTRQQMEDIFTGKITNWKELGGKDLKITPYSRETSSGTYEFFKEQVLNKKNFMSDILSMPATGAIIQSISQTEGAIGYVGLAYLNKNVKAVSVSYDDGKTYVAPSVKTAKDETYPIVRPLFYYYTEKSSKDSKGFVDFILSKAGQKIVEEEGYIGL